MVRFNLDNYVGIDITDVGGYSFTDDGKLVVYPKDYMEPPFIYTCDEETKQKFDLFMEGIGKV